MAAYGSFKKDGSAAFLSVKKDLLVFFFIFIVCSVFLMYCVSAFMLFRRFSILYCFTALYCLSASRILSDTSSSCGGLPDLM
jgi:hypothetical protein